MPVGKRRIKKAIKAMMDVTQLNYDTLDYYRRMGIFTKKEIQKHKRREKISLKHWYYERPLAAYEIGFLGEEWLNYHLDIITEYLKNCVHDSVSLKVSLHTLVK